MTGYKNVFAQYYDSFTGNVDYPGKAAYLADLALRYGKKPGLVLDLACGTGSLAVEFARMGMEVIAVDGSPEMLMQGAAKNVGIEKPVFFLCQPMQELDLYGTVEVAFCTLDSLNHLPNLETVDRVFGRLQYFVESGGLFLFDMNTPYKHQVVLGSNVFVYETPDVCCVWKNDYLGGNTVRIDLDFFVRIEKEIYSREQESFCERAYSVAEITALLEKNHFRLLKIYGDYNLSEPSDTEQRIVYIAQRM